MSVTGKSILALAVLVLGTGTVFAQDRHDPKAVSVLKAMETYLDSMSSFTIEAESYLDHEIDRVALISNPSTSTVQVDRSGKLHSKTTGLVRTTELFFNDGTMTIYTDDRNFYAQADVPSEVDDAIRFALEELDVETPLFDLVLLGLLEQIVSDEELIIYISEDAMIRGVQCHQVLISGPHADMQLWIESSDTPVPRRMIVTNRVEFGHPRHEVFMNWIEGADASAFEFTPPEGALEIQFVDAN